MNVVTSRLLTLLTAMVGWGDASSYAGLVPHRARIGEIDASLFAHKGSEFAIETRNGTAVLRNAGILNATPYFSARSAA
jgi:hypothetical protein